MKRRNPRGMILKLLLMLGFFCLFSGQALAEEELANGLECLEGFILETGGFGEHL